MTTPITSGPIGTRPNGTVPDNRTAIDLAWLGATLSQAGVAPIDAQLLINQVHGLIIDATVKGMSAVLEAVQKANSERLASIAAVAGQMPWFGVAGPDRDALIRLAAGQNGQIR